MVQKTKLRTLTFNTSINLAETTYENWKNKLVSAVLEKSPDIVFLQENFNYHYWIIAYWLLLPLHLLFQQIPFLCNFCQVISYFILAEGFIMYQLSRATKYMTGYSIPFIKTYDCYDDFLCKLEHKYDIYYDRETSKEFNTIMSDGLYFLIKKNSGLTPMIPSFKKHTYSVNNGANQKCINMKVQYQVNNKTTEIISLFNTHLHFLQNEKNTQLNELKKFVMLESMKNQIIVSGDLNMDYRNEIEKEQINKFCDDLNLSKCEGDYITCISDLSSLYHTTCDKQLDYTLVSDAFLTDSYMTPNILQGSEHLALIQDLNYTGVGNGFVNFFK